MILTFDHTQPLSFVKNKAMSIMRVEIKYTICIENYSHIHF